jgi:hypothetical protein
MRGRRSFTVLGVVVVDFSIVKAEGWYKDPYQEHDDRWISDGTPTSLVRDGEMESDDPPPDEPFSGPLVEPVNFSASSPDDLKRADDHDQSSIADRAFDVVAQFVPPI